jgi:hypothetical protein
MRGLKRIGLLAISVVCILAFTAVSAFGDADDELLTSGTGVLLRDINTATANQPSAVELVNAETTKLEVVGVATSECTESEFGSFVTKNKAGAGVTTGPELSVPFGVFENCTLSTGGNAPVYLDTEGTTKAASGVEAKVWDEGAAPFKVELKGLKLSLYVNTTPVTICKLTGTIIGVWTNGAGPFTENSPTNQSAVDFKGQTLTGKCNTTNVTASIKSAKYFVETMSDSQNFTGSSDTVFFKSS